MTDKRMVQSLFGICVVLVFLNAAGIRLQKETGKAACAGNIAHVVSGEADMKKKGNPESGKVALTFDDGPDAAATVRLLDALHERGIKASFFVIGEKAQSCPEIVRRMADEGHLIGNHTFHHVELSALSEKEAVSELRMTEEILFKLTGESPDFVRPPFGKWNENLEKDMGIMPVLWTVDPLDWTTEDVDIIVNKVVTEVKENDIILLHDCYETSVDAAIRIMDILIGKGYRFVTVDEILID